MMRSLYSGVSGIKSHQTRMDVIGNNISNVNTIGFKSSRVTFADMLSQTTYASSQPTATIGGTNPRQIGLGNSVTSVDMIMTDGSAQATGKNTDVALSGNGFMVLSKGSDTFYTRDGAFEFDADGNYVLPGSGYHVQGWNAVDGTLSTTGIPENIVIKTGKTMAATATTNITYAGNLNASALTITGITYTADPSGDASAVTNDQQINQMIVWYTDGTSDTITSDTTDYSNASIDITANPPTVTGTDTMLGKSVSVGSNRKVNIDTDGGVLLATKTVESVEFALNDARHQMEIDTATDTTAVDSDTNMDFKFTSGTFTIYDSDTETTRTTESVNIDGKNVIAATLTLSDGSTLKVASGFYELGHSVPVTTVSTVYDAEGNTHAVTLLMDKTNNSAGNAWRNYIAPGVGQKGYQTQVVINESDGTSTTVSLNRQVNPDDASDITTKVTDVYFTSMGAIDTSRTSGGSLFVEYGDGNGAADTTVAIDYNDITQYSGGNTLYPTTDGNSLGLLQSISIDVNGVMSGTYTNGIIQTEAQIAVAQFVNSAGLTKTGTSLYKESNNSGQARIGTMGDLGLSITPSALEMSNVELASELVDMIVTQRGFQSNSKVITVGDEMLETIVNMKR